MIDIFGPETPRLLRLMTELSDLRPENVNAVAEAWRSASDEERAAAWATLQHGADAAKRITIQNAALVARHQALIVARSRGHGDSAFWSAAWDAAGALAGARRNGDERAYRVLVHPMATTLHWLLDGEQGPGIPLQRGAERGTRNEPIPSPGGGCG